MSALGRKQASDASLSRDILAMTAADAQSLLMCNFLMNNQDVVFSFSSRQECICFNGALQDDDRAIKD
jgi:hypothetical protein